MRLRLPAVLLGILVFAFLASAQAPPLTITTLFLPGVTTGAPYSQTVVATGGTLPLTFSLNPGPPPPGLSLNPATGAITGTAGAAGSYPFTIAVTDATGVTASRAYTVAVNPFPAITEPSPLPESRTNSSISRPIAYTGGTAPLSWSISAGALPPGISLTSGNILSGTTPASPGTFNFTVRLKDATNSFITTKGFTWEIRPPLSITTASPLPATRVGATVNQPIVTAGGLRPLVWAGAGLPPGLTLNAATGVITGTPTTAGVYTFDIQVQENFNSGPVVQSYTWTVNPPLSITTASPLTTTSVGAVVNRNFAAADGTPPYSNWAVAPGLPPGLTLNSSTGAVTGSPTAAGTSSFTVSVRDSAGVTATKSFSWTIGAPPTILTATPLPPTTVGGLPANITLTASGGVPPLNFWAISAGALPGGVTLNSTTGLLSGTALASGTFAFTVRVQDAAGGQGTKAFSWTVNGPPVSGGSLPRAMVGQPYTQTLPVSQGTPPFSFAIQTGGLPAGLTLSPAGVVAGIVSAEAPATFTVRVTDAANVTASVTYTLDAYAPPRVLSAANLPGGVIGVSYSHQLGVGSGAAPFTWKLLSGALPTGLELSSGGLIDGVPQGTGMSTFAVGVTDELGGTASAQFSLQITRGLTIVTASPLPNAGAGKPYSISFAAAGGAPPYVWSIASGSLPAGISFDPVSGSLFGTSSGFGASSFTLRVQDSANTSATRTFDLTVGAILRVAPLSMTFTGAAGGAASTQNVSVLSIPAGIGATLAISAQSGSWLSVAQSKVVTPALIGITADPAGLAPGSYQGTVTVTGAGTTPVSYTVNVTLDVTSQPPSRITSNPGALSFYTLLNGSVPSQVLNVSSVGGAIPFTALPETDNGGEWMTLTPTNGAADPSTQKPLTVKVNPAGLRGGTYTGRIRLRNSTTQAGITVPVTLLVGAAPQSLFLSQTGLMFQAVVDGSLSIPSAEIAVLNGGRGEMDWLAASSIFSGSSNWIAMAPSQGSSGPSNPAPEIAVSVDPSGLPAGDYYGLIDVTAPGAEGSPQSVMVVLNVTADNPGPVLKPSGLIFTAEPNGSDPKAQTVKVSNLLKSGLTFVSSTLTEGAAKWLTITPASGSLPGSSSIQISVQPQIGGLSAGVRRGSITLEFSDGSLRVIEVVLVLPAPGAALSKAPAAGSCSPAKLVPVFTSLAAGFTVPAGWPVPIQMKVVDDCGNPVSRGAVTATFSSGDPQINLISTTGGNWSATWTPRRTGSSSLTVTGASRTEDRTLEGVVKVTGGFGPGGTPPIVDSDGVVSAASQVRQAPLANGTLINILGTQLSDKTAEADPGQAFPTQLAETQVFLAGQALPLRSVSDRQVVAVVPFDLPFNTRRQVILRRGGGISVPETIVLSQTQPGVFTVDASGQGQGIVADASGKVIDASNPAKSGDTITIYCTGLGEVTPKIPAGTPATDDVVTVNPVEATIGRVEAQVNFAGLAPGQVGIYRVEVVVPAGVAPGDQVPITLVSGDAVAPPVTVAVR